MGEGPLQPCEQEALVVLILIEAFPGCLVAPFLKATLVTFPGLEDDVAWDASDWGGGEDGRCRCPYRREPSRRGYDHRREPSLMDVDPSIPRHSYQDVSGVGEECHLTYHRGWINCV